MSPATDRELETWWIQAVPDLYSVGFRYLRSQEATEDVVQDLAVLALNESRKRPFKSSGHLKAWALKTLRWRAIDVLRKSKRSERLTKMFWLDWLVNSSENTQPDERISAMVEAAENLPERQKQVFHLMLKGQNTEEIAGELNIQSSSVRSLWRFARAAIAQELTTNDIEP